MKNYVITISRQTGSGGTILGRALSKHFGFSYLDNEMLKNAVDEVKPSQKVEWIEGSLLGSSLLAPNLGGLPYMSDTWMLHTDPMLFKTESEIMRRAVEESSCVITGRCGSYLFRSYERHVSIFLQAGKAERIARIQELLDFSKEKAKKMIEKADKDRERYFSRYTGEKWLDMEGYDLCVDTSALAEDDVKEIVLRYIEAKFPELKKVV